jgi:hypothetical protein
MPRLRYIEESEKTPQIRAMIASAERTGAPDPRVVSIMTRSKVGLAWVELCSHVAKAEGLTEEMINDLFVYETSPHFTPREKAALRYASLFKQGEHAIDKDEVYADLAKHFNDEEIIELGQLCAQTDGVGKLVKSLNVVSWEEACEINPKLADAAPAQQAAE